jgi:hypothetical protein
MDVHVIAGEPGEGALVTDGGDPHPVMVPLVDDTAVALVAGHMLWGGIPGSGKSALFTVLAAYAAMFPDDDPAVLSGGPGR